MQEDKCAERLRLIREKIASLQHIDPSIRISKEEIEERKKQMFQSRMPILPPRSENQTASYQIDPNKPVVSIKNVFTLDSSYYKNLHQKYQRSALANISAPRNEIGSAGKMKEVEPSKEGRKEEGKQEVGRFASNLNQPASLIKLQPVIHQEESIPEPQENIQTTKPALQHQPIEVREAEPQSSPLAGEIKQHKQKGNDLANETKKDEQIKPPMKNSAEPPKLNLFTNPSSTSSLFGKKIDGGSLPLFSLDKDKKIEVKPFTIFSQKPQPLFPSQVKVEAAKSTMTQPNPSFFNLPPQNDTLKPELQAVPPTNSQKGFIFGSQQASLVKPFFPTSVPNVSIKEQDKQATQPQQKKPTALSGLFANSQKVTSINTPLTTTNELQKPKPLFFNDSQQSNKPLFGGSIPTMTKNVPDLFGQSKPTTELFSINTSNDKAPIDSKPLFTPNFPPAKSDPVALALPEIKNEGLFQKKPFFGELQTTATPEGGLFSNSYKDPLKVEQKPASLLNEPINLPKNEAVTPNQQVLEKQPEKGEKKEKLSLFTAIGPGGKKIELQPLFTGEAKKQNFFSSSSANETKNIFTQPSPTSNLFQTSSSNNIFTPSTEKVGLFSQQNPTGETSTLLNKGSNNLFGGNTLFASNQSKPLFGSADNSLFNKGEEEEEGGEEEDDGPIEAEDDANPSLSTGKYDYVQTQVHFKESANKFREGIKDTLDNIIISIQSFENSEDKYLYVRMPNKCIAYCGKFLKDVTECRSLNSSDKNVEVKKLVRAMEGMTKPELSILKIQFKDESVGSKFMKEVGLALGTA